MSWLQGQQQAEAARRAQAILEQGGLSPEELAAMRREGEARIKGALAGRGLLDSGLLPGAQAALEGELALAKARAKAPFQSALAQMLSQQSQQPSLLSSLIPIVMQHGLRGPGGEWWIPPYDPSKAVSLSSELPTQPESTPPPPPPIWPYKPRKGPFSY